MERIEEAGLPKKLVAQIRKSGPAAVLKSCKAVVDDYEKRGLPRPSADEVRDVVKDILGIGNARAMISNGASLQPALATDEESHQVRTAKALAGVSTEPLQNQLDLLAGELYSISNAMAVVDGALGAEGSRATPQVLQVAICDLDHRVSLVAEAIETLAMSHRHAAPIGSDHAAH